MLAARLRFIGSISACALRCRDIRRDASRCSQFRARRGQPVTNVDGQLTGFPAGGQVGAGLEIRVGAVKLEPASIWAALRGARGRTEISTVTVTVMVWTVPCQPPQ